MENNNLVKYFTWEFVKVLIFICVVIGGFFELKTEIIATKEEIKEINYELPERLYPYKIPMHSDEDTIVIYSKKANTFYLTKEQLEAYIDKNRREVKNKSNFLLLK